MKSLDEIQEGELWFDPTNALNAAIDVDLLLKSLPKREADVLAMMMDGFTHEEIAESLSLSSKTVQRIIRWLRVKLGA